MRISPTKSTFSLGKKFWTLDTYAKKMNPPSIVFGVGGGGVHGKVCWLQGRIGNEKVICHVMGLGAPYRKFQIQLQLVAYL